MRLITKELYFNCWQRQESFSSTKCQTGFGSM